MGSCLVSSIHFQEMDANHMKTKPNYVNSMPLQQQQQRKQPDLQSLPLILKLDIFHVNIPQPKRAKVINTALNYCRTFTLTYISLC